VKLEVVTEGPKLSACTHDLAYEGLTLENWLRHRRTGIGGSEAGIVYGMSSPYRTPLSIWADKTGRLPIDTDSPGEAAEVGNVLEPLIRHNVVAPYVKERMGLSVTVLDPTHMYRSVEWPWMIADVDGWVILEDGGMVGLEIKTGSSYMLREWGGREGDEIPDLYYAQCQHYLAVTGLSEWWAFGLIGNQRVFRSIPRNEAFISELIDAEREFWETVLDNDPLTAPAVTGSDVDTVLAMNAPWDDEEVDLTDYDELFREYAFQKGLADKAKESMERIKAMILEEMDGHSRATSPSGTVKVISYEKDLIDQSRLKKERPDVVREYTKKIRVEFPRIDIKKEATE
jgi:putative phage-type endonuclease